MAGAGTAAGGDAVQQCGSGVTACHNLLAMAHAGLGDTGALYPGSWSEWSSEPGAPGGARLPSALQLLAPPFARESKRSRPATGEPQH